MAGGGWPGVGGRGVGGRAQKTTIEGKEVESTGKAKTCKFITSEAHKSVF